MSSEKDFQRPRRKTAVVAATAFQERWSDPEFETVAPVRRIPEVLRPVEPAVRGGAAHFREVVGAVVEVVWFLILATILGFLLFKGPVISRAISDVASVIHDSRVSELKAAPAALVDPAKVDELQARLTHESSRVAALERSVTQLKQKNAELEGASGAGLVRLPASAPKPAPAK